jgi:hypothetical protein
MTHAFRPDAIPARTPRPQYVGRPTLTIAIDPSDGYTLWSLAGQPRHVVAKRTGRRVFLRDSETAFRLHRRAVSLTGEVLRLFNPEGRLLATKGPGRDNGAPDVFAEPAEGDEWSFLNGVIDPDVASLPDDGVAAE